MLFGTQYCAQRRHFALAKAVIETDLRVLVAQPLQNSDGHDGCPILSFGQRGEITFRKIWVLREWNPHSRRQKQRPDVFFFDSLQYFWDIGCTQDRKSTRLNSSHVSISYA